MTVRRRLAALMGERLERLLTRLEDPGEALEYAYQVLVDQLGAARTALGDLDEVRASLEAAADRLETAARRLEGHAGAALREGSQAAAREAAARSLVLHAGARSLRAEAAELGIERDRFAVATDRLEDDVRALAGGRQATRVQADRQGVAEAAATARAAGEQARGAVRRAEAAAAARRAQVNRVDALLWSGAAEDLAATPTALAEEVRRTRGSGEVDRVLDRLRRAAPPTGPG